MERGQLPGDDRGAAVHDGGPVVHRIPVIKEYMRGGGGAKRRVWRGAGPLGRTRQPWMDIVLVSDRLVKEGETISDDQRTDATIDGGDDAGGAPEADAPGGARGWECRARQRRGRQGDIPGREAGPGRRDERWGYSIWEHGRLMRVAGRDRRPTHAHTRGHGGSERPSASAASPTTGAERRQEAPSAPSSTGGRRG